MHGMVMFLCAQAMESKLLAGGLNIFDKTNEQQRELEQQRQKMIEQKVTHPAGIHCWWVGWADGPGSLPCQTCGLSFGMCCDEVYLLRS